jgi:hypothetical protein
MAPAFSDEWMLPGPNRSARGGPFDLAAVRKVEPAITGCQLRTENSSPNFGPIRIRSSPGEIRADVQSTPPLVPWLRFR